MALLAVKAVAVTKLASGGSCAYGHGVAFRPWTHGGVCLLSPVAPLVSRQVLPGCQTMELLGTQMQETQDKWGREVRVGNGQTAECHDEPNTGAVGALR